ncbi:MAG: hypothetical protein ACYDH8_16710 [Syntrophales bacterium]
MVTEKTKNTTAARIGLILLAILFVFYGGKTYLWAYAYTYHNSSNYTIRIVTELYDGEDKTIRIDTGKSETISTQFLLKSWRAEAFFDNMWEQILNFTCDVLPGDHNFSIYVQEAKDDNGKTSRAWNAITDGNLQKTK